MSKQIQLVNRYLQGLALTIGPLFIGWGVGNLRAFFQDPARCAYVALAVLGSLVVFVPRLNVPPFSKGTKVVGQHLTQAFVISDTVLLVVLPFADRRSLLTFPEMAWVRWIGFALVTLGSIVRVVGVGELGRQFSGHVTLQNDHRLVQSGIYKQIRHPMYLGILMVMPGVPLVFRSWLVFPVAIWSLVFVLLRMGQEEQLLSERFGDDFEVYRRRSWRLMPYVY